MKIEILKNYLNSKKIEYRSSIMEDDTEYLSIERPNGTYVCSNNSWDYNESLSCSLYIKSAHFTLKPLVTKKDVENFCNELDSHIESCINLVAHLKEN